MSAPITFPPLDAQMLAQVRQRYDETGEAETRTRYHMILLAERWLHGSADCTHSIPERRYRCAGAQTVRSRADWTLFLDEPRKARRRTITVAWEVEWLRVIELDPHEVGVVSANWTTELLADYLGRQTGITVTQETVRVSLHAHGYVCKRPTWTLRRKAEEKADYVGNACG